MYRKLADTIILDFTVSLPTTGAVSDADTLPTVEIWEDETDTTLAGGTVTKRVGKTGNYRVAVAATTANGFEVGKSYNVVVTAIAGGVTAKSVIGSFAIDGKRLSDLNDIVAPDLTALTALVTRSLGLAGENMVMDQTVFDADKKLTSARIRIYDSAANALAAGATGVIATFPLTMTWATKLIESMTQVIE